MKVKLSPGAYVPERAHATDAGIDLRLIELIKESVGGCATYWASLIADHLIENGVTVQRWIPVGERLPDETKDEYVLVVCEYYDKITVETRKMWHVDSVVTHWMYLPEPPKGEQE